MRWNGLAILAFGLLVPLAVQAQDAESVGFHDPVLRVLPGNTPAGGYFRVTNNSESTVTLTGVSSPAFNMGEMHESTMVDGNHRMEKRPEVTVAAGGERVFRPGGYHLMMMGRQVDLSVGDTVQVIFEFSDGSTHEVPFDVVPPTYQ